MEAKEKGGRGGQDGQNASLMSKGSSYSGKTERKTEGKI